MTHLKLILSFLYLCEFFVDICIINNFISCHYILFDEKDLK